MRVSISNWIEKSHTAIRFSLSRFTPSHGINVALEACVYSQHWEEIKTVISFMQRHLYTSQLSIKLLTGYKTTWRNFTFLKRKT